jgi:hypothetical protein
MEEEQSIAPRAQRVHAWKGAHLALSLDRNSAPVPQQEQQASSPRSPQSWSSPTSPNPSPRPTKERVAFSLGKNRAVRPSADTMREALMSVSDGVEVGDHKMKLRTYQQCFVAARCADWLVERFELPREEALEFCQQLLDDGWMKHANGAASRFTDSAEELFQWCQQRTSLTQSLPSRSLPIFSRAPRAAVRSYDIEGLVVEEPGSVSLSSSFSQRKRTLQTLTFGEEVVSKFHLIEPSYSANASENPLHVAKALQLLPQVRNLKTLCLRGLKLAGDVFLMCMGPTFKKLHVLTNLDISQNDLGASCLISLVQDMDVSSLKDLRLQDVKLQSGMAEEITLWNMLLKSMRLHTLDVSKNELTDASITLLGKNLSENATLQTLLLDENAVSSSGQLSLIQALLWNPSLQYVYSFPFLSLSSHSLCH